LTCSDFSRQPKNRRGGPSPEQISVPPVSETDLDQGEGLFDPSRTPFWELLERARRHRQERFGARVHLCAIVNAKSGSCPEDCAFCAQSARHGSAVPVYPLIGLDAALEAARQADSQGVRCFSLVTSGRGLAGREERRQLLRMVERIRSTTRLEPAVSLGVLDVNFLFDLKSAGLETLHHNLETAPSFYGNICSTHPFEQRFQTILNARSAGLKICSGGIFGLGESFRHRAEMALVLRAVGVDRVPVNFLNAIPGTPLERMQRLNPLEALQAVAALRLLLPDQEILVCGGRGVVLRSLQPLVFAAGANGIMTGNYLTTPGQAVEQDLMMLEDWGLRLEERPQRKTPDEG